MSGGRCADLSRAADEPLAATATNALHWLLVEVRGGWSREVTGSDALPAAASASVSEWISQTRDSRLLFVRRPGRTAGPSLVFVVDAGESSQRVRRLELDGLEELARVELATAGEPSESPLVLVCGHGSRDQCCALRGTAVFGALAPGLGEEQLWMSSHQGGHRFAANVLVFPAGLQFGRVEPREAPSLVGRALAGSIELSSYRGRTCYEPIAQAAEHAIRAARGFTRVSDLTLLGGDDANVRFRDAGGREHVAVVDERESVVVPPSCGDDPKPQRVLVGTIL